MTTTKPQGPLERIANHPWVVRHKDDQHGAGCLSRLVADPFEYGEARELLLIALRDKSAPRDLHDEVAEYIIAKDEDAYYELHSSVDEHLHNQYLQSMGTLVDIGWTPAKLIARALRFFGVELTAALIQEIEQDEDDDDENPAPGGMRASSSYLGVVRDDQDEDDGPGPFEEAFPDVQANVRRVHNNAVAAAKKRNQPFTMTLQDTMNLMVDHAPLGLIDEDFELPSDLIGLLKQVR